MKHYLKIKWMIDHCDESGQIRTQEKPPHSGLAN